MSVISRGLEGIVAAQTTLSDVQGEKGCLTYAGYNINDLAEKVTFEEVMHLLWHNKLPTVKELEDLKQSLRKSRELPQGVIDFILRAPKDAAPIDILRTAVSMLQLYDRKLLDGERMDLNRQRAISISAKIGVIVAYFHQARQGKPLLPVRDDLDQAAHFLYLISGEDPTPDATKTLDIAYTLHADHSMNASTFSSRVTISTLTDIYSALTSAIGTLKGPLHGGANEAVIHMLKEIDTIENVEPWILNRLDQKQKIMGFGHRIYKTLDPRAPHLKAMGKKLAEEIGEPKWIDMSEKMVEIMAREKGLNANVDFYSAIVYYSLGIPTDLFTPIFAIARTVGWTAHILEQLSDNRLFRPESEYIGTPTGSPIIPIEER